MLSGKAKKLADVTSSMEHYLQAIYDLRQERGFARVSDIAERLDVAKATVSHALKVLADRGLVRHASYGFVELWNDGEVLAKQMKSRFRVLRHFLSEVLGVEAVTAEREACLAEHVIGAETVDRLIDFIKFLDGEAVGTLEKFRLYHRACRGEEPCSLCGTNRCDVLLASGTKGAAVPAPARSAAAPRRPAKKKTEAAVKRARR